MKLAISAILASVAIFAMPVLAASHAEPPKDDGKLLTMSLGCGALNPSGILFNDPLAVKEVKLTPSGHIKISCKGHLLADIQKPSAEVHFNEKNKAVQSPCPDPADKYEETIEADGSFKLICHFR